MKLILKHFLLVIMIFMVLAFIRPELFSWVKPSITWILGLIMFGMGVHLDVESFKGVFKSGKLLIIGTLLQFVVMPLLAIGIATMFGFETGLVLGMVLVGASPGGTASNVIVFLSKGNLALSVTLTFISTLLAPLVTPLWVWLLLRETVDISFVDTAINVVSVVLLPVLLGLFVGQRFPKMMKKWPDLFPVLSVVGISLIIAFVLGANRARILEWPILVFSGVILHNLLGILMGYVGAGLLTKNMADKRTIAIEVGMQNSGLAVQMASKLFPQFVTAVLPGALFSFWHNLSGVILAKWWGRLQKRDTASQD